MCVPDVGSEPVEQRLADPVEGGAQAVGPTDADLSATPATADDAKRARGSPVVHGWFLTGLHFPAVEVILVTLASV